jgi:hypothetical protein
MGQLILQGIPPYSIAYNMKMPGVYLFYAIIMAVFGETPEGIRTGYLIVNFISAFLMYLIVQRVFTKTIGLYSATLYAFITFLPGVLGQAAHATQFVVPFVLAAVIFQLKRPLNNVNCMLSGICISFAFLMKQHAIAFFPLPFILISYNQKKKEKFFSTETFMFYAYETAGIALPFILTFIAMSFMGVLDSFIFWTFSYAREYISEIPLYGAFIMFSNRIGTPFISAAPAWILSWIGVALLLFYDTINDYKLFFISFFILSFVSTVPGLYFRPHYFILFIPSVVLLNAVVVSFICTRSLPEISSDFKCFLSVLVVAVTLFYPVVVHYDYLFLKSPERVSRELYGGCPFIESEEIADWIKENTDVQQKVAVIGSEPQIYFLSKRISATGYMYMYPLMERQPFSLKMQKELAKQVEENKPEILIFVNSITSWSITEHSYLHIFKWFEKYKDINYTLVGIASIGPYNTHYFWGKNFKYYKNRTIHSVEIYRKNRSY